MALTRRIKKLKNSQVVKITGRQMLVCKECGKEKVEVSADVCVVTCAYCVQKMVAPPVGHVKEKSDKPKGWQFKKYFEHNGIVYSKGKIVSDPEKIAELKETGGTVIKVSSKKKSRKRGVKRARTTK